MVGDDGQRLQGSRGQLALAVDLEKPPHPGVEFRPGGEDVAPATLDDGNAAFGGSGALEEILEGLLDLGRRMVAQRLLDFFERKRLQGDEDQGFDDIFQTGCHGHCLALVSRRSQTLIVWNSRSWTAITSRALMRSSRLKEETTASSSVSCRLKYSRKSRTLSFSRAAMISFIFFSIILFLSLITR